MSGGMRIRKVGGESARVAERKKLNDIFAHGELKLFRGDADSAPHFLRNVDIDRRPVRGGFRFLFSG